MLSNPVARLLTRSGGVGGVERVEVQESHAAHGLAIVDVRYAASRSGRAAVRGLAEMEPVQIVYGSSAKNVDVLYGYINHAEDVPLADTTLGTFIIRYVILGTSAPMNTEKRRSWYSMSRSAVAKEIAQEYGLRAIVHPHRDAQEFIGQADETDFRLLVRLAEEIGYRFWVEGATLWFVDPTVLLAGPQHRMPTFRFDKSAGGTDTIEEIETLRGRRVPGNARPARQTVYGYDERAGKVFLVTNDADVTLPARIQSQNVRSVAEGQALLAASDARNVMWSSTTVRVRGDVAVHPGVLVNLTGRALTEGSRGTWLVTSARHVVTRAKDDTSYLTEIEAVRGEGSLRFQQVTDLGRLREKIPCRLVNGTTWQAQSIGAVHG